MHTGSRSTGSIQCSYGYMTISGLIITVLSQATRKYLQTERKGQRIIPLKFYCYSKEIHSDKLNPSLLLENFNYTIFSVSFVKLTSWRCRLHKMPCVKTLTEWLAHKALIIVRKKCFQRLVPLVSKGTHT